MDRVELGACLIVLFLSFLDGFLYTTRNKFVLQGKNLLVITCALISNLAWVLECAMVAPYILLKPWRGIVMAIGYTIGSYLAMRILKKHSQGSSFLTFIVPDKCRKDVQNKLIDMNIDYTILLGSGMKTDSSVFKIALRDKSKAYVEENILKMLPDMMVIDEEVKF